MRSTNNSNSTISIIVRIALIILIVRMVINVIQRLSLATSWGWIGSICGLLSGGKLGSGLQRLGMRLPGSMQPRFMGRVAIGQSSPDNCGDHCFLC